MRTARAAAALCVLGLLAREGGGTLADVAGPWSAPERIAASLAHAEPVTAYRNAVPTAARCAEFEGVVEHRKGTYALPAPTPLEELSWFLYLKHRPTESRSVLARSAAPMVARLEADLAKPGAALRPAELLERCIGASDGDVPLAVLACHNLLKEVMLRSRTSAAVSDHDGRVAARLASCEPGP